MFQVVWPDWLCSHYSCSWYTWCTLSQSHYDETQALACCIKVIHFFCNINVCICMFSSEKIWTNILPIDYKKCCWSRTAGYKLHTKWWFNIGFSVRIFTVVIFFFGREKCYADSSRNGVQSYMLSPTYTCLV